MRLMQKSSKLNGIPAKASDPFLPGQPDRRPVWMRKLNPRTPSMFLFAGDTLFTYDPKNKTTQASVPAQNGLELKFDPVVKYVNDAAGEGLVPGKALNYENAQTVYNAISIMVAAESLDESILGALKLMQDGLAEKYKFNGYSNGGKK